MRGSAIPLAASLVGFHRDRGRRLGNDRKVRVAAFVDLRAFARAGRNKEVIMVTRSQWRCRGRGISTAIALPLVLLISLALDTEPQTPPFSDGQASRPYRISVNVDLVVLHPTVRDPKGRFVSDARAGF